MLLIIDVQRYIHLFTIHIALFHVCIQFVVNFITDFVSTFGVSEAEDTDCKHLLPKAWQQLLFLEKISMIVLGKKNLPKSKVIYQYHIQNK